MILLSLARSTNCLCFWVTLLALSTQLISLPDLASLVVLVLVK